MTVDFDPGRLQAALGTLQPRAVVLAGRGRFARRPRPRRLRRAPVGHGRRCLRLPRRAAGGRRVHRAAPRPQRARRAGRAHRAPRREGREPRGAVASRGRRVSSAGVISPRVVVSSSVSDLGDLGRYAGPATLILSSLAEGPEARLRPDEGRRGVRTRDPRARHAVRRARPAGGGRPHRGAPGRRQPAAVPAARRRAQRRSRRSSPSQRRVAETGLRRLSAGTVRA